MSDLQRLVQPYASPSRMRSLWQLASTALGLLAVEAIAVWVLAHAPLALIPLALIPLILLIAGFLVRLFIFQHDCGHGSFFASARARDVVGTLLGFATMTPYEAWRHDHAIHHATTGNLDRRGTGDIETLTVDEYAALPRGRRIGYRLMRNPLVLFGLAPAALFMVGHRFTRAFSASLDRRARRGVHLTNAGVVVVIALVALLGGWQALLFVHVPAMVIAASAGVFLFYVQHQIERPSWSRTGAWSLARAAMEGASHLRLPRILRYFTGDIGVHHIHHLAPRIPNYRLQACLDENPALAARTTLSLRDALRTARHKLFDEASGAMVGFPVALPAA